MAMSMKKIGAIAVGGAMVASALASGAFAAEKVGDVDAFAANAVTNGNVNVDIVVGSNAAAQDVVSAANVAAKIGSLMFKEGSVDAGSAKVTVSAEAESDDYQVFNGTTNNVTELTTFVTSPDKDYNAVFNDTFNMTNYVSLGKLDTLVEIDDIDPSDWYSGDEHNAAEIIYVQVNNSGDSKKDEYDIDSKKVAYISAALNDSNANFVALAPGLRIPFLGEEYALVKIDTDDDLVIVGKEVFDGVLKEGESYDLGNGYAVKVESILKQTSFSSNSYKANVKILKDGKVVAEKFEAVNGADEKLKLVYKDVGVVVNDAWENVGSDYGYAELLIVNNVVTFELGEEFLPDWEVYLVDSNASNDMFQDDASKSGMIAVGLGLLYVGDDEEKLSDGDDFEIADYVTFALEEDDDEINALFKMDQSKEVTLNIGQKVSVLNAKIKLADIEAEAKEAVVMAAPIAVLDTEASLDAADKALILVGGPVVNTLAKELADKGLIAIDNASPATLAVAKGAANGNDVLVVAGGDRDATTEAAEALISML